MLSIHIANNLFSNTWLVVLFAVIAQLRGNAVNIYDLLYSVM